MIHCLIKNRVEGKGTGRDAAHPVGPKSIWLGKFLQKNIFFHNISSLKGLNNNSFRENVSDSGIQFVAP